jgi:hypothetical protein
MLSDQIIGGSSGTRHFNLKERHNKYILIDSTKQQEMAPLTTGVSSNNILPMDEEGKSMRLGEAAVQSMQDNRNKQPWPPQLMCSGLGNIQPAQTRAIKVPLPVTVVGILRTLYSVRSTYYVLT